MRSSLLTTCVVVGLGILASACSDTFIDPFANAERYFTIYGFLDPLQSEQKVRVIAVKPVPERILSPTEGGNPNVEIDARVTSTDLISGDRTIWRHSLEKLDNGLYGHIFRAKFIVRPGRTYRLVVERSDGIQAIAETTVPTVPGGALFFLQPVAFSADSTTFTQHLEVPEVSSLWDVEAIYLVESATLRRRVFIPYGRPGSPTAGGGWALTLNLSDDQKVVQQAIDDARQHGEADDSPVQLSSMGVRMRIMDQQWTLPQGSLDPEALAQPGTLSNVTGGYGFWGSIGLQEREWIVSTAFSDLMGFE